MSKRFTFLLLLALLLTSAVFGQSRNVLDFYPLHTGNFWQYHYHYCVCACQTSHSSYHREEVVGDTVLPTGYTYKIIESDLPGEPSVRYLRVDSSSANVFKYTDYPSSGEELMDSLHATQGSMFIRDGWIPTECTGADSSTVLEHRTMVKYFTMYFVFGGDYALARHLGRIEHNTYDEDPCYPALNTYYRTLVYARINGEEYGTFVSVSGTNSNLSTSIALSQNYPNPFNPTTTFSFSIPHSAFVTLSVYNLLGREVATIVSEQLPPGRYTRQWDAIGLATGLYFYRLRSQVFQETRKLVVTR